MIPPEPPPEDPPAPPTLAGGPPDFADADVDDVDRRLLDVLRGSSSGAELRQQLQGEQGEHASDLLGRLDALDFVQQVVGHTEDVPERLGEYRIKGVLGRGGMGIVYLGWQEELEREVALKVLSPHYSSDSTMRKRFRAEARATAALHHRHIVPIYDYGQSQGMLYFAMERVDGMSLDKHIAAARRLEKPALPPLEAARRFAGVADALGLAHRRRLLHRDVKPGNILVSIDGTLALTDFGLAKALDQVSMHLTSKGGGFLGTLHYSSPEQALGTELTPASDLYSLGVTIFEAVTGELPLHGKTTEALLQAILHGTPRRLRDFLPKPPRDLEAVLDKLLSREPGDRYQDGEELARDLQRIADGEPVHIRRLPLHVRIWRRARKNPVLAGAIAAAAVLLLVTVALLTVLRREKGQSLVSRHQNNLAAIARDVGNESGPPWGPAGLLGALTGVDQPAVPPSAGVLAALARAQSELADEQVAAMRTAYADDPLPAATALLREGRGYEAQLRYDQAIVDALAARAGTDFATEIGLYGLFLGRGVANLTASVARINEARTDLALASYLRRGAVFPRVLLAVLDVAQSADVATATERLQRDLELASPERARVVGLLLWNVAALRPFARSNLMDFGLSYPKRRALHELAAHLLGEPAAELAPCGAATGFAGELATSAGEALLRLAEPAALRDVAQALRQRIDGAVHPESPLQGWRSVMQLLETPTQLGPLLDRDGQPLPPLVQLAAWEDLLRLRPRRQTIAVWLPRFDELRRQYPSLPGMLRVAAQLHQLADTPVANDLTQAWFVDAAGDPEALLWRMRAALRRGGVVDARDDAMVAVQESVDRGATIGQVVRVCGELAPELEPAAAAATRQLAAEFAALVPAAAEVRR
ncbi:MAG: serine/threonine protein kinase [Planctomycetes bacterium]|nr:serine/threonine protein kinase [Planctomycetota bacterium]